jgi:alpha-N-arabinofuranosidase
MVTTSTLGKTKLTKEGYENPDGTPLKIGTDYFGNKRSDENISAGPFTNLNKGEVVLKVW